MTISFYSTCKHYFNEHGEYCVCHKGLVMKLYSTYEKKKKSFECGLVEHLSYWRMFPAPKFVH